MAYKKYISFSFDDGLEQDKRIIQIFKEAGLNGCTFNLNSGLFGEKKVMCRIGEYGFMEKEDLSLLKKKTKLIHYVEDYRIPADEIAQVYEGFEIACHGFRHENMKKIPADKFAENVRHDKEALEKLCGYKIVGYAYPFGAYSTQTTEELKKQGILYARTTSPAKDYGIHPEDSLTLKPYRWIPQKDTVAELKKFVASEPVKEDQMFYMWGHGYEFDFGTPRNNWDNLKRLCEITATGKNIICCQNREIFLSH